METKERQLVRRKDGRIIAGVAGGLADYTGTPVKSWRWGFAAFAALGALGVAIVAPALAERASRYGAAQSTWLRLGLLIVLLAGGLAEWAYLLLWWLTPRADLPQPAGWHRLTGGQARIGLGLLVFAGGLLGRWLGLWGAVVVWATLLIGVGLAVFRNRGDRESAEAEVPPMPAPGGSWDPDKTQPLPSAAGARAPRPRRARRRLRERSKLGWLSFGLALVVGGLIWWLDSAGSAHVTGAQMLAAVLAVLGVGLLVGAFVGHAKWTVLFGLPLIPIAVVASAIGMPFTGRYADRTINATTGAQLQPSYVQTGGQLTFYLTQLQHRQHAGPVQATLGIGQITVYESHCVPVDITASVGLGDISLQGRSAGGPNIADTMRTKGPDPVRMDLHVGVGSIQVYEQERTVRKHAKGCAR